MREVTRLLFVGDVSLGGDYAARSGGAATDWTSPFSEVRPIFQDADLRIGNLEDPLYRSSSPRQKRNLLAAPPESVAALCYLGFDALNIGNNHITDQGAEGIRETRRILESKGITPFGAGENLEAANKPAFVRVGNLSFAFLGYTVQDKDVNAEVATESREGCVPLSLERAESDIAAARQHARHVVVSLHWGYQYDRYPDPEQIATAHKIIDLGALIVYGHHPHAVQGMERYKNGLILYSLGNFFFPGFLRADGVKFQFPRESRSTVAVLCDVGASGIQSFSAVPLATGRGKRIRVLEGHAAARATQTLVSLSTALDEPAYTSLWQMHHGRTERKRRRQEEGFRVRGDGAGFWRRAHALGIAGSLRRLKGRHVVEVLRLVRRSARLLHP